MELTEHSHSNLIIDDRSVNSQYYNEYSNWMNRVRGRNLVIGGYTHLQGRLKKLSLDIPAFNEFNNRLKNVLIHITSRAFDPKLFDGLLREIQIIQALPSNPCVIGMTGCYNIFDNNLVVNTALSLGLDMITPDPIKFLYGHSSKELPRSPNRRKVLLNLDGIQVNN